MSAAKQLVDAVESLASLPAVYHRVKQVSDNPTSGINDLADVVAADAAMTARLLRVVNSVYFGLMSRVDTVTRAVSMLGMQQVHDIVLATTVAAMFKGMNPVNMNMTRFWSNSVMRALIARTGAEMARAGDVERFFVAGLLADLGHLVIYQVKPDLAEKALQRAMQDGIPLERAERDMLGCDYAEVGAALIEKWKLPERLSSAIGAQLEPSKAKTDVYRRDAAMLNLARIMVDGMEQDRETEEIVPLVNDEVWTLAGLKPANAVTIRMIAEMNHNEVITLFFPNLAR